MPKGLLKEKSSLLLLAENNPFVLVGISGVLFILSFPPFPFPFFIYFAFVPLLLVLDGISKEVPEGPFSRFFRRLFQAVFAFIRPHKENDTNAKEDNRTIYLSRFYLAFRYSYITFLVWNLGSTYWLAFAFVEGGTTNQGLGYLILSILANVLNPILICIPILVYYNFRRGKFNNIAPWAFACFWTGLEWLRFQGEMTWPWLTLGHTMGNVPVNIQYAEFTGVLGVSFHILLCNVLIFLAIRSIAKRAVSILYACLIVFWVAFPYVLNFLSLMTIGLFLSLWKN